MALHPVGPNQDRGRQPSGIIVGFGWLVDEVVWACAIVVLSVDVDI